MPQKIITAKIDRLKNKITALKNTKLALTDKDEIKKINFDILVVQAEAAILRHELSK